MVYAVAAFAIGACVYCLARADSAWLLPDALHFPVLAHTFVARATGWLPVFAHVVAMAWLTTATFGRHSRAAAMAGPFWAIVNVAFEVGQHPRIAQTLAEFLRPLEGLWLLERIDTYFLFGSFDPLDVAAALAAGAVAWASITRPKEAARPREVTHVRA